MNSKDVIHLYKNSNLAVRAGIWFLAVTVIDKGVAIITQPIINRILSIDDVGTFGVYTSWKSIIAVIATFNLWGGVLEVYLTEKPKKKDNIVASLCSLSITISLLFWTCFFLFCKNVSIFLGLKKIYIVVMGLAITSEAIISFWSVPKRFEYAYREYSFLVGGIFITKCLLSVILAYLMIDDRVLGRILGLTIPPAVVAIFLLSYIWKRREKDGIFEYWRRGFCFNLPLIPHYLSTILLASSDKVMIQKFAGKTDAGLYTLAYSFGGLALIVFDALSSAYNPSAMKAIKNKNYYSLKKSTEILIFLSVGFSIYMMLMAPEGIWLLGGEKYLVTIDMIPVLIVGIYFSSFYFIFSKVEFIYEKTKLVFPITLMGALINIGLNYVLIPIYGYKMAAYTTFFSYLLISIAHYIVSRTIVGEDIFNMRRILFYVLCLLLGGIGAYYLYQCDNFIRYIVIGGMTLLGFIVLYQNKERIMQLLKKK